MNYNKQSIKENTESEVELDETEKIKDIEESEIEESEIEESEIKESEIKESEIKEPEIEDFEIEVIEINLDIEDNCYDEDEEELAEYIDMIEKKGLKAALSAFLSYILVAAIALGISFTVNKYVILNAHVPTSSMAPTINPGDKLFAFRMAYLFSEPERGDIIVFNHQMYKNEVSESLLKRIIGIPGDKIEIKEGVLYLNDVQVEEEYIAEEMAGNFGPYIVPENSYFVLGDNRNISDDARFWDNVYVHRDEIQAKAFWKYNPKFEILN